MADIRNSPSGKLVTVEAYNTVEDDGVPLPQRENLNFVGFNLSDDGDKTTVESAAGGSNVKNLGASDFQVQDGENSPPWFRGFPTNFPIEGLLLVKASAPTFYFNVPSDGRTEGDLTLKVTWFSEGTDADDWELGVDFASVSPSDGNSILDKTMVQATALANNPMSDTVVANEMITTTITITNSDGLADGDFAMIRLTRRDSGDHASDVVFLDAVLTI